MVLGLVRDLFFRSKLDAIAESVGVILNYASTLDVAVERCAKDSPALVLVDLSDGSFPASETASRLRAAAPSTTIVGFASHIDLKPLRAARDAGFDKALSRSEFTAQLSELIRGGSGKSQSPVK